MKKKITKCPLKNLIFVILKSCFSDYICFRNKHWNHWFSIMYIGTHTNEVLPTPIYALFLARISEKKMAALIITFASCSAFPAHQNVWNLFDMLTVLWIRTAFVRIRTRILVLMFIRIRIRLQSRTGSERIRIRPKFKKLLKIKFFTVAKIIFWDGSSLLN